MGEDTCSTMKDEYVVTSDVVRTKSEPIKATSNGMQNSRSYESEKASPFPLHFLLNTPVGTAGGELMASPLMTNKNYAEEVIHDNMNKLLNTGKEFDNLDKIFDILDNNVHDDDHLWRDMQEQSSWFM